MVKLNPKKGNKTSVKVVNKQQNRINKSKKRKSDEKRVKKALKQAKKVVKIVFESKKLNNLILFI